MVRTQRIADHGLFPIEQGRFLDHPVLRSVAARHHATLAQVALAWVLRKDNVCAIPRTGNPAHVRENRVALDMHFSASDCSELDYAFPPPPRSNHSPCTRPRWHVVR
jgi:diketogulonate reductase-like aldo/keto reductase